MLGALIATRDGLLVHGNVPAPLTGDALAGFLPEMFQRVSHYTEELKMGTPSQLALEVDGRLFSVRKIPGGYLAVISRPGEPLSEPQITTLTSNLSQFAPKE